MSATLAIANGTSLAELAEQANDHHQQALAAANTSIEHARAAGQALVTAKKQCRHGAWTPWLRENFEGSGRTARAYMQLARNWPEIEEKMAGSANFTTIDAALKLLRNGTIDPFDEARLAAAEYFAAANKVLDDPNATIEQLKEISEGALEIQNDWAEYRLRSEREAGKLLLEIAAEGKGARSL